MELKGKELADFENKKIKFTANLKVALTFLSGMLFMLALVIIFK